MSQQQYGYGYGYDQAGDRPTTTTVVEMNSINPEVPFYGWCNMVTAVMGFFCCTCCGFPATVMAILGYVDHKNKEFGRSRGKINAAYALGGVAIGLGSLCVLIFIILMATGVILGEKLEKAAHDAARDNEYYG